MPDPSVSPGNKPGILAGALPGLAALLVGIGLARFGYTPLLPALIERHWLDAGEAVYLGATNLAGYLGGSLLAAWLAQRYPAAWLVRLAMLAGAVSFVACAFPLGFWWFVPWRFLAGFIGSVLMVLAVPLSLANLPLESRGRGAGIVFTGVGIGVAASGTLVPVLAGQDLSVVWLGMAALAFALTMLVWRGWNHQGVAAPATDAAADGGNGRVMTRAVWLLLAAYALDAFAFVPHTVFWVDYIARGLGRGLAEGGTFWVLYGVGALCGPILAGLLAEKLGFHRALVVCYFVKSVGLLLPVFSEARPALVASSLLVGALTPGISAILSGRIAEMVGPARHRMVWGWMTTAFAVAQAGSAYSLGFLFTITHSYVLLYLIAGVSLIVGGGLVTVTRK